MNTTIYALQISNIKQSPFISGNTGFHNFYKVNYFRSINSFLFSIKRASFMFKSSRFVQNLNSAIIIDSSVRIINNETISQTLTDIDFESLTIEDCVFNDCESTQIGGGFYYNPSTTISYLHCLNSVFISCTSETCGAFSAIAENIDISSCCFANCFAQVSNQAFSIQGAKTNSVLQCTFLNCPDYIIHSHQLFAASHLGSLRNINVTHCNNNLPGIFFKISGSTTLACSYACFHNNTGQYPIVLNQITKLSFYYVSITSNKLYDGLLLVQAASDPPSISFFYSSIQSNLISDQNSFGSNFFITFQYYSLDQSFPDLFGKYGTLQYYSFFSSDIKPLKTPFSTVPGCIYREMTSQASTQPTHENNDNFLLYSISSVVIGIALGATIAFIIYYLKKQKSVKDWYKQGED